MFSKLFVQPVVLCSYLNKLSDRHDLSGAVTLFTLEVSNPSSNKSKTKITLCPHYVSTVLSMSISHFGAAGKGKGSCPVPLATFMIHPYPSECVSLIIFLTKEKMNGRQRANYREGKILEARFALMHDLICYSGFRTRGAEKISNAPPPSEIKKKKR